MHLGGGVFSEGGFTVWVVLEFIWAIVGGIVIILLPGYELIRGFMGKDALPKKSSGVAVAVKVDTPASTGSQQDGDIVEAI